jgi:imidazole glycerol-phosphate synthase subunit HisF
MVLSIEAIKVGDKKWEAYYDNGREKTGIDVVEWAKKGYDLGAGEILLTSIDKEGTSKGFDCELVKAVSSAVPIPVIASGGMGNIGHLKTVITEGMADAVAVADVLHYGKMSVGEIRQGAAEREINVRRHAVCQK